MKALLLEPIASLDILKRLLPQLQVICARLLMNRIYRALRCNYLVVVLEVHLFQSSKRLEDLFERLLDWNRYIFPT